MNNDDFDNGNYSTYNHAAHILEKYNIKPTKQIISGNIRDFQTTCMSWNNLRSMKNLSFNPIT